MLYKQSMRVHDFVIVRLCLMNFRIDSNDDVLVAQYLSTNICHCCLMKVHDRTVLTFRIKGCLEGRRYIDHRLSVLR